MFSGHQNLRVLIDAALEGTTGTLLVDDQHHPRVARLEAGVTFLGGSSDAPKADQLIASIPPGCHALVPCAGWERVLRKHWGLKAVVARHWRMAKGTFSVDALRRLIRTNLPIGCEIAPIGVEEAYELPLMTGLWTAENFGGVPEYLTRGFGAVVRRGGSILAGCSTFAVSRERAELGVVTIPHARRRGIATAVSASVLIECLLRGIEPCWHATSQASVGLALKLGFTSPVEYQHFLMRPQLVESPQA